MTSSFMSMLRSDIALEYIATAEIRFGMSNGVSKPFICSPFLTGMSSVEESKKQFERINYTNSRTKSCPLVRIFYI